MSNTNRYTPLPSISRDNSQPDVLLDEIDAEVETAPDVEDDVEYAGAGDQPDEDVGPFTAADVWPKLEGHMTALMKYAEFACDECWGAIEYIYNLTVDAGQCQNQDVMQPWQHQFGQKFAKKLTEHGFVEVCQKMWKMHLNEEVFQLGEDDRLWKTVNGASRIMWNMIDKSTDMSERVVQANLHADILKYLSTESFKLNLLQRDKSRRRVVRNFLSILHDVVRRATGARNALRGCRAIEILQPFRKFTENREISFYALVVQAYIVKEDENEHLNSDIEIFKFLVELLDAAIRHAYQYGLEFSVVEVLEVINKLAVNDGNKQRIVEAGALPYYVKLLQPDRRQAEQKKAAHGLWILGFKCRDAVRKEPGCIPGKLLLVSAERPCHYSTDQRNTSIVR